MARSSDRYEDTLLPGSITDNFSATKQRMKVLSISYILDFTISYLSPPFNSEIGNILHSGVIAKL